MAWHDRGRHGLARPVSARHFTSLNGMARALRGRRGVFCRFRAQLGMASLASAVDAIQAVSMCGKARNGRLVLLQRAVYFSPKERQSALLVFHSNKE
jgi:hypothetical protein